MTDTTAIQTLADLVGERPARAGVLDRLGLDYCCHGQRSLAEACTSAGLDVAAVEQALDAVAVGEREPWEQMSPLELAAHIVATHHSFLRDEMPAVILLADKVRSVHGDRHPELAVVGRLVAELWADLEPHLDKEEHVLFPAIDHIAAGDRDMPFGTVANPIRVMMAEHDQAGDLLARLREVTAGFLVPDDACGSYRSLYDRLSALELDTHVHIHKENNVLFPAVIDLEHHSGGEGPLGSAPASEHHRSAHPSPRAARRPAGVFVMREGGGDVADPVVGQPGS